MAGSMEGEPMSVAIALSLILAQVNTVASGFKGSMFTFESIPTLVQVIQPGDEGTEDAPKLLNIGEMVARTRAITWGGTTNIDLTMDLFIARALHAGITKEAMALTKLVIYSDMNFDSAITEPWETAHETLTKKFKDAGYDGPCSIVFWNLAGSTSIPVKQNCAGVVLLSGFSAGLLNSFLAGNLEAFTPQAQLSAVINQDIYKLLKVAEGE
jgi:hypothetical protein